MKPITAIIVVIASLGCCLLFMISAEGEDGEGRIVFDMIHNGNSDIFSLNIDGKNLKNLTNHPAIDHFPSPSPNGKYIAFTSDRNNRNGNPQIFIMDSNGKNPKLLIDDIIGGILTWSPDSKWIAFVKGSLFIMNVNTGEVKKIFEPILTILTGLTGLAWSPDGKRICFRLLVVNERKRDLYTIDIDGTNLTRLTNDPEGDSNPSWSPDGKQIAFYSARDGGGIFIMDSDGGNIKLVHRDGYAPSWSPDGKKIAFSSKGSIFIMNPDGSNVEQVYESKKPDWADYASWLGLSFNVESESKWKTSWGKVKRNF